jgi:predicted nucleic acid-binding protein
VECDWTVVTESRLMLLLDSEAISAVAHGPAARRDRVRALAAQMRARQLPVGTVAAVLAEVVRGRPRDAGVFSGLRRERVEVHPVDTRTGIRAGQLLGRLRAGSEMAVDAFLVAAADVLGGAVIATTDPDDLRRLAAHASKVEVVDLNA